LIQFARLAKEIRREGKKKGKGKKKRKTEKDEEEATHLLQTML